MKPTVSVILPAYNCPAYIGEAVESMLAQTFEDFELIVIDDGSTDETPEVVRRYRDPRIQFVSQANVGLAATLNRGIAMARGELIARQDQDDRSLPERLAKQVAFMATHPDHALVGTWAEIWREQAPTGRIHTHPADDADLKYLLLLNNPFVHSSVMLRRAAIQQVGGYTTDPARQPPEDYELWSRIARQFAVANLPEVLHVYREVRGSMSRSGPSPFLDRLVTICAENIGWWAGVPADAAPVVNLAALEHHAAHRIEGNPDFRVMRIIFRHAAARAAGHDVRRFEREADRHVSALAARWRDVRFGRGWRRPLRRAAHRARQLIG
ncbi:MAG: glycosyltransferase family A protein [Chloroflexota bacterium]